MQIIRFTKFWGHLNAHELGQHAQTLGYDGLDLAVRDGHAINPKNVVGDLSAAVRGWKDIGIECSMISAGTSLTDPANPETISLFEAAAMAGVPRIKIGYFTYTLGDVFDELWTHSRRMLAGFEKLSQSTGVQTLYHTHSGRCLGSNCAGLRHLLDGYEPAHIGAYVDLGHLALNGEDVQMGLPMLRDRLSVVGAKDAHHIRDHRPQSRAAFADKFVLLGHGAAEWPEAIALLKSWNFSGPLTIHTEYTMDQDVIATVGAGEYSEEARALRARGEVDDLAYLRNLIE
ncbi:MAG: hypothetical protein CL790_03705 [Chloroflexi bacterium]|nr:hypothetical protein [Chloroflexota bacterium]HCU72814.1 hypothetical protein [Chloroflexota bacterium]|tara:strand:+ start:284 stop:1144 length:861 start_codon:yes stop_codon:yes gene_type:complete